MPKESWQNSWKICYKNLERMYVMKKLLILAGVLAFTMSSNVFAAEQTAKADAVPPPPTCGCPHQNMKKPPFDKAKFEKRLKLTDAQKEQAKVIRQKGHDLMKPVMEKMGDIREEMHAVRLSKLAQQAQEEKLAQLRKEMKDLKKQANDLRMQNMKEFESILTKKQLKELNKMKEEGRKAFEKAHKKQLLRMPPMGPEPEFEPEPPSEK